VRKCLGDWRDGEAFARFDGRLSGWPDVWPGIRLAVRLHHISRGVRVLISLIRLESSNMSFVEVFPVPERLILQSPELPKINIFYTSVCFGT